MTAGMFPQSVLKGIKEDRVSGALQERMRRVVRSPWLMILLIFAWLAFSFPSLLTYPALDSDEALFSSVSNYFYTNGSFLSSLRSFYYPYITDILHGRFYALILGLSFQLLGIGVLQGRLVALTGGLLSGLFVLNIGRALKLSRVATLSAVALFWTSWRTLFASHSMRPEIWIVAGGLLAIYLQLRSRRTPTRGQYFILGFVTSYLLDIHLPAIFYSVVVTGQIGLDVIARRTGLKQLLAYGMGGLAGLAAWTALWFLPNFAVRVTSVGRGPLSATSTDSIWRPWAAVIHMFQFGPWLNENYIKSSRVGGFEVAIVLLAIFILLIRRTQAGKYLLICLGLLLLALFVTPYRHSQHAVLAIPLASLIVACAADSVGGFRTHWRGLLMGLLVGPLLGLYIVGGISLSWRSRPISYENYASALRQIIPPGSSVLGEDIWWFKLHDGVYRSDISLPNVDYTADELYDMRLNNFKTMQFEYILVDERLGSSWQEPVSIGEINFRPIYERLLNNYCEPVGEVDLPYIGVERGGPANKHTTVWHCDFGPP